MGCIHAACGLDHPERQGARRSVTLQQQTRLTACVQVCECKLCQLPVCSKVLFADKAAHSESCLLAGGADAGQDCEGHDQVVRLLPLLLCLRKSKCHR